MLRDSCLRQGSRQTLDLILDLYRVEHEAAERGIVGIEEHLALYMLARCCTLTAPAVAAGQTERAGRRRHR
jgi:hypothetical protein